MFCMACGSELPDDANFCLKCGRPQRGGVTLEKAALTRYEICEIRSIMLKRAGTFSGPLCQFQAMTGGPDGRQAVLKSETFRGLPEFEEKRAKPALDGLITELTRDGWEFDGSYDGWYWAIPFKRPLAARTESRFSRRD